MLIYGKPGILFKCKDITCLLNETFNIVIFNGYTAVQGQEAHAVGFSVPIKYIDFIKTVCRSYSLDSDLKEIFNFSNEKDFTSLKEFVLKQDRNDAFKIVPGLFPSLKATRRRGEGLKSRAFTSYK